MTAQEEQRVRDIALDVMRASGRVIGENIEELNEIPSSTEEQQLYTLPGVKKDANGQFAEFFALDIFALWKPCRDISNLVSLEWADKKVEIQNATNNANTAARSVQTAIDNANSSAGAANEAASSANSAAQSTDRSRQQIEVNENTRQANETTRQNHESSRETAEGRRAAAETTRENNETERKQAETGRKDAESERAAEELNRKQAESGRSSAESSRVTEEGKRATAESGRATAEQGRVDAESARVDAEQGRVDAEAGRVAEFSSLKSESEAATALANDVALHPTYVDASGWVYEYNSTSKTYNKTEKNIHGRNFTVDKVFQSVAEMNAFRGAELKEGNFFMVNTGSVEDEDTAKLYIVDSSPRPQFLIDMSGARGFTGHTPQFSIGIVTTGNPGTAAQATVSDDGTDSVTGDPKYKLNLVIPKGDAFTYTDFTVEQIAALKQPATEAAAEIRTEWKGSDGNGGLKKTITDWYDNTVSAWNSWFSDSLADGVRKKWDDFWSNINTRWADFFGEETGTPTKGVQKTWADWFAGRGTEWNGYKDDKDADWTSFKNTKNTDWGSYKSDKDGDWASYKNGKDSDWTSYKGGKDTDWAVWIAERLSAWNTWWDGRKSEWTAWFSDTLADGVRKKWNDFWSNVGTQWENFYGESTGTPTKGVRKIWTDWFGANDSGGVQKEWKDLRADAVAATGLANEKAGLADGKASLANEKAGYAQTQGDYAKNMADHPAYIGDGTNGDLNFWYVWNYATQQYVKDIYAKGDDLHYDEMTQQEKEDLAQTVLSTLAFDDEPTEDSRNPVTSGGIYTALEGKQDNLDFATDAEAHSVWDEYVFETTD